MANYCFSEVTVTGPTPQVESYLKVLNKIFDDECRKYLGDIMDYLGEKKDGYSCAGHIDGELFCSFSSGNSKLNFCVISRWVTQIDPLIFLRDHVAPDCKIYYTSEEPMMDFFESNDPDVAGKWIVSPLEEDALPSEIDYEGLVAEEKLHRDLEKLFGKASLNELLKMLCDEYCVHVHRYEPTEII